MSIEPELLREIFLKLTIFFLLVTLLFNLIKTKLMPLLYEEIEKEQSHKKNLIDANIDLEKDKKNIDIEINKEQETFLTLENKVKIWNQVWLNTEREKSTKYQERINFYKNKREIQVNNLDLLKMENYVIPKAIDLTKEELSLEYKKNTGTILLKELINKINIKENK